MDSGEAVSLRLLERCSFPAPGSAVACAVSGGADSLTLMILANRAGCEVTAWHVDHGLRANSRLEAGFVQRVADRFGVKFESRTVDVAPGPNVEARARSARYGVLPSNVLTGHTADDQAETVLINLLRGAGLDGLSGMRNHNKPLLTLRRSDTESLCTAFGIEPFRDPTNSDPALVRNRVRHELIPLMDDIARRDTRQLLVRQAAVVRTEVEVLDKLAETVDPTDARDLAAADPAVATRALRAWLREALDSESHPPDLATLQRAMRVVRGDVRACELPGGRRLVRSSQRLSIVDRDDE